MFNVITSLYLNLSALYLNSKLTLIKLSISIIINKKRTLVNIVFLVKAVFYKEMLNGSSIKL